MLQQIVPAQKTRPVGTRCHKTLATVVRMVMIGLLSLYMSETLFAQTSTISILNGGPTNIPNNGTINLTLRVTNTGTGTWTPVSTVRCNAVAPVSSPSACPVYPENGAYTVYVDIRPAGASSSHAMSGAFAIPIALASGQSVDITDTLRIDFPPGDYVAIPWTAIAGVYGFGPNGVLHSPSDVWNTSPHFNFTVTTSSAPIAHFTFDTPNNPGDDIAGSNDATQVLGVTQVANGVVGLAGSFTNGWMQLPRTGALNLAAGDFTLSVFVKSSRLDNRNWFTKAKVDHYGLGVIQSTGAAGFNVSEVGGRPGVDAIGNTVVFDGTWHHVAGVRRGSQIELWVDGQLDATAAIPFAVIGDDGGFAIGRNGECCEYFNGLMDEAKIWNRALSAGEIAAESRTTLSGPLAWYRFDTSNVGDDVAGGHNAIQVIGVTQTPTSEGVIGSAGRFINGWMQLPATADLNLLSGNFTLSVFIKSSVLTNSHFFTKASTSTHRYGLGLTGLGASQRHPGVAANGAGLVFNGNESFGFAYSDRAVFDGTWHHVVGIKSGNTAQVWVDGVLAGSGAIITNFTDDGAFAIGRDGQCCQSFTGLMDEVKIWNRALSANEISLEANLGSPSGAAPSAFSLLSPTNGQQNVGASATLTWQTSIGAGSYSLYFGTSNPPSFSGSAPAPSAGATSVQLPFPYPLLPGQTYYWYVDAVSASDVTKKTSNSGGVFSFKTVTVPPIFLRVDPWSGVPGAVVPITIFGDRFSNSALDLGADITITHVTVVSSTKIQATLTISPTAAMGRRTLRITNDDGQVVDGDFGVGRSSVMFLPGIEGTYLYTYGTVGDNELWIPNRPDDVCKLALDTHGHSVNTVWAYDQGIIKQVLGTENIYKTYVSRMDSFITNGRINEHYEFAYDWRFFDASQSRFNSTADTIDLAKKIRDMAKASQTGKVTLIGHSTGGLVSKKLVDELCGKGALCPFDRLITVATPHLGTPKGMEALLHAETLKIPILVPSKEMVELAENVPTAYLLSPSASYFNLKSSVVDFEDKTKTDPQLGQNLPSQINSYADMKVFLQGGPSSVRPERWTGICEQAPSNVNSDVPNALPNRNAFFSASEQFHQQFDAWKPTSDTGVKVYHVAGNGLKTFRGIKYFSTKQNERDREHLNTTKGDGTVVFFSAAAPGADFTYVVNLPDYNDDWNVNRDHASIMEVESILDLIESILDGDDKPSIEFIDTTTSPPPNYTGVKLNSPGKIHMFDSAGRHTGTLPASAGSSIQMIEKSIPNSSYEEFAGHSAISVPPKERVTVHLNGTGFGVFSLSIEEFDDETSVSSQLFSTMPIGPKTQALVDFQHPADVSNLRIDIDGNGSIDFDIIPGSQITAEVSLEGFKQIIQGLPLSGGIAASLTSKIDSAVAYLPGNSAAAIVVLSELIREAFARAGTDLTNDRADGIVEIAAKIMILYLGVDPASIPRGTPGRPTANPGIDVAVSVDAKCRAAVVLDGTGSTDPENDPLTYLWSGPNGFSANAAEATVSGLLPGVYEFTLTVSDGKGGSSIATKTVTVVDRSAPTFDFIPPSMTVNTPNPILQLATATDPCGSVIVTNNAPATFAFGSTTITWIAKDEAGNVATATTVVIMDNTSPVTSVTNQAPPPNGGGWNNSNSTISLASSDTGTAVKDITITLTGAQTGTSVTTSATATVAIVSEGITKVTWYATDNAGNQELAKTLDVKIDKTPPSVTPPASVTVPASESGGVTSAASNALAAFLASGSATDVLGGPPVQLFSQVGGVNVTNSMLFPLGTTSVTFRFRDSAGNIGTATSNVTVVVGQPRIAGSITGKGIDNSTGQYYVDLQLSNTGTGNARNLTLTQLQLRTLAGTGTVTTISPSLPLTVGSLDAGASTVRRIYLNRPATVTRFSVTENGTLQDVTGTAFNFSIGQSVIP